MEGYVLPSRVCQGIRYAVRRQPGGVPDGSRQAHRSDPLRKTGLECQHRKHVMQHLGILDEVDSRDSFDGQASNRERSRQKVSGFMVTN